MKNILKFAGVCSLVLAVVAFILLLSVEAFHSTVAGAVIPFGGSLVIFGGDLTTAQKVVLGASTAKGSGLALVAWLSLLVGLFFAICGLVLPLLKKKKYDRIAGLLNICAALFFVLAGVFTFTGVSSFFTANGFDKVPSSVSNGGGWIVSGILAIVAGVIAICPAVVDFVDKKKK